MVNILMVTSFYPPYHVGGACTHVYYLANALARKGHRVHVLASRDAHALIRDRKRSSGVYPNSRNVTVHWIDSPWGRLAPLTAYTTTALLDLPRIKKVLSQRWDLIHYHNLSLFGPRVMRLGNAKKIMTAHDHWLICPMNNYLRKGKVCSTGPGIRHCTGCLLEYHRPPQFWRATSMLKDALEHIDRIITPSAYLKDFLRSQGIDRPMSTIPNTVPANVTNKAVQKEEFFLFVGMLERPKGIEMLIETFKALPQKRLIILGDGSLKHLMQNLPENIVYKGYLSGQELSNHYAKAQALILPSICPENCPLTVLEAMSQGTPSIVSDLGGSKELVTKEQVFRAGDTASLTKKIMEYRSPGRKKTIDTFKRFNEENYIRLYEKLLKDL
ncbi:glycosyltransferase [Candidatus Woesearchaeota archaeon]|nr:glycosyltransferase [Candidatus Woesearchaeota archaeon]